MLHNLLWIHFVLNVFLYLCQTQTSGPEEVCSVSAQLPQQHSGEDGRPVTAHTSHADHRSLQTQAQDRRLPHFSLPQRYFLILNLVYITVSSNLMKELTFNDVEFIFVFSVFSVSGFGDFTPALSLCLSSFWFDSYWLHVWFLLLRCAIWPLPND